MSTFIDLAGQKFGRLFVIRRMDNDKWGKTRWLCKCDCKNEIIILSNNLRSGCTKSCGCLRREKTTQRSTKHGHRKNGKETGIYKSWTHMIDRCTNPNNKKYKDYGGRGITVCKRWSGKNGFIHFLEDMGKKWKPGLTIHRRDNNKGYYKNNCEWATQKEQQRNRRDSIYVPYNGKNRLLVELCEELNMPYKTVYARIYKYGWSVEKALTEPVRKHKKYKKRRKNG